MLLKTILNRVAPQKSFVYRKVTMVLKKGRVALEIDIEARRNSQAVCSGCHRKRPGYDRLPPRRFEFVPLWQIAVFFVYAMRRVDCPTCGVVVEQVPWSDGKSQLTTAYRWFLAGWARRLSWLEVAVVFHTTWEAVYRSVEYAVAWGLARRRLTGITGHRRRRGSVATGPSLPDVGLPDRRWGRGGCSGSAWTGPKTACGAFSKLLTDEMKHSIRYLCSDMWKPYLNVLAQEVSVRSTCSTAFTSCKR